MVMAADFSSKDGDTAGVQKGGNKHAEDALCIMEEILAAMINIRGKYFAETNNILVFDPDSSFEMSVQEVVRRVMPLCQNHKAIVEFVKARLGFEYGLDFNVTVAQLEHQLKIGKLSLQRLWLYCQPVIQPMRLLAELVTTINKESLFGAAILNLLQHQAWASNPYLKCSGQWSQPPQCFLKSILKEKLARSDALRGGRKCKGFATRLAFCIKYALLPFIAECSDIDLKFVISTRKDMWVCEGVIDDPEGEFLIEEDPTIGKDNPEEETSAQYWRGRYKLTAEVPVFLASSAELILTTGKYLNALQECGEPVKVPSSEGLVMGRSDWERVYLEQLHVAHATASQALVDVIVKKGDLIGRLRTVKHFFLLDQSDFLNHFMDTAKEELLKRPKLIHLTTLQALLELAVKSSSLASDPYHEDITCCMDTVSLVNQLHTQDQASTSTLSPFDSSSVDSPLRQVSSPRTSWATVAGAITGIDTVTLDIKTSWPTSLILSKEALTKYQYLFRFLFLCKHAERQLGDTWHAHQGTRVLEIKETALAQSYLLCQQMLHFIRNLQQYSTYEVLEPRWYTMVVKIAECKSVDEVMDHHSEFLNGCLAQCLLQHPKLFRIAVVQKLYKQINTCLKYTVEMRRFFVELSSLDHEPLISIVRLKVSDKKSATAERERKAKGLQEHVKRVREAADKAALADAIGSLDTIFSLELKDTIAMLVSASSSEPSLSRLAKRLHNNTYSQD
eukprot:SM000182S03934  [mRNA]  locus=s182:96545:102744:+ [translate_table: standard]